MRILIYNHLTNKMEKYDRNLSDPMPYSKDGYLSVREFRGSSNADTIWADRRAIEAFNKLRTLYGKPIKVGYAFKRITEGGHTGQSQHYAGMAFDIAQNLSTAERDRLRNLAINSKLFSYVEPKSLTPTWIHIDKRDKRSACSTGGYPVLKQGKKNTYVAVLQDALTALGYSTSGIDGIFGANTKNAVLRFQRANSLVADGIVGCNTWRKIVEKMKQIV